MDQKVCESKKRLNAENAQTIKMEKKLAELETQLSQMRKDASDADAMDTGTSNEAMVSQISFKQICFTKITCKNLI